jgi:ABC-type sugar transport system permease subunit
MLRTLRSPAPLLRRADMSLSMPYPAQLEFHGDRHIRRWRPLVQWLLAIPQLMIAAMLTTLRTVLSVVSFFTVLFTRQIPRALFDVMAMTLRYEWRAASYALFLHEDYPPFDFEPAAADDGVEPHTTVTLVYPEQLARWKPLYKWLTALPHYFVLMALAFSAAFVVLGGFLAVVVTGEYPAGARDFLVGFSRYNMRVQAYVGLLTDQYPPFSLTA